MPFNFEDTDIFDAFVDANFDSLLEEECVQALQRSIKTIGTLIGDAPLRALALAAEKEAYASQYSGSSIGEILKKLDQTSDAETILERLFQTPDFGLPYKLKSWLLKMYAMIGTLDIEPKDPTDMKCHVEALVVWAEHLAATLMKPDTEPYFLFFTKAARARLDLDQSRHPRIEDFQALARLARHPHSEPVGAAILDLPTKTIQNLISAKTLERFGEDRLTHSSAHAWISKQWDHSILYPSKAFQASSIPCVERTIEEPVFVPILSGNAAILTEPFLPEHSHTDGYHIEASGERKVIPSYWAALEFVQQHPACRVSTRHHPQYTPFTGDWKVFEKSTLEKLIEIERAVSPAEQATLCTMIEDILYTDKRFSIHRKGHSIKMLRYVCSTGEEIAIERRPGKPLIYLLETTDNLAKFGSQIVRTKGPGPTGRNSNLNAIESFAGRSLIVLKPSSLDEAQIILDEVVGSNTRSRSDRPTK